MIYSSLLMKILTVFRARIVYGALTMESPIGISQCINFHVGRKKMKKIFSKRFFVLITATLMLFSVFTPVLANDEIGVTINGQAVDFPGGQGPVIVGGRTLVPVRGVFETLGFEVGWDNTTRTAIITNADYEMRITIDNDVFTVNGISHTLDVPAQLIGGRTMVPIRLPLEAVGFDLDWNGTTRTVLISAPEEASVPTLNLENLSPEARLRAEVANAGSSPVVIDLTGDVTLREVEEPLIIPDGANITLKSSGGTFTLSAGGNFHVIYVETGASLTIDGVNISRETGTIGRGITNRGSLTLVDGIISGHNPPEYEDEDVGNEIVASRGAGVLNRGDFIMLGGEISNNTAQLGVGVHNWGESATFTLEGGAIKNNTALDHEEGATGGAVNTGTLFTMTGGEISGNTSHYGGGVAIIDSGMFIMQGGTISENTAEESGGGVNSGGTFIMEGGTISNNTAEWAGGVGTWGGTTTITGGEISGNTAKGGGGAAVNGTFILEGGTISGNTATEQGGGVTIWGGTFTMSGGAVSGNTATGSGGGVNVSGSGTFTFEGGTISDNRGEHGAGVMNSSTFTLSGGTISNNTGSGSGGGVNNSGESSVFNMTGGEISGNSARWGGGVNTWGGAVFTMTNGTISNNTAEETGGGVSNGANCTFTISGGTITRNHAGTWGGGVFTWGADRTFNNNGGTISDNTADSGAPQISEGS
jgi:hypothetical protein